MKKLIGVGASRGVALGQLYYFNNTVKKAGLRTVENTNAEQVRFDAARKQAIATLGELYGKAHGEIGPKASMIFKIHQMLLEDQDYVDSVDSLICDMRYTAEYAVQLAGERFAQIFAVMDDAYMKERCADMIDISTRVMRLLCGEPASNLSQPQGKLIIAANDLLPSETIQLDRNKVQAMLTCAGSKVSHTAILARTMGIPAVVGLGRELSLLQNGDTVLVDGFNGTVVVDPSEVMIAEYNSKHGNAEGAYKNLVDQLVV
ncbi:phosphoenolpyruvate-utilizing N-terminal domain-containing protein [Oscillospiraceae bacterium PP1C4]